MLQSQPLYIKGPEDPETAAQGCYGGAGIYALTMVLSLLYIWQEGKDSNTAGNLSPSSPMNRNQAGNAYGSVPS